MKLALKIICVLSLVFSEMASARGYYGGRPHRYSAPHHSYRAPAVVLGTVVLGSILLAEPIYRERSYVYYEQPRTPYDVINSRLSELSRLYDNGYITWDEYQKQRDRILRGL